MRRDTHGIRNVGWLLAGLLASTMIGAGCRSATLGPDMTPGPLPAADNAELMAYISELPFVTAESVYRSAYVLRNGAAYDGDYAALESELASQDIIPNGWSWEPNALLTRGDVAIVLARTCEIGTGLNYQLTGLGRYALRELIRLKIAQSSANELKLVSGGEFLGILNRAEAYLAQRKFDTGRLELGRAPGAN